jgi:transposase
MDDIQPEPVSGESTHTTGRKSARGQRVEIITRGERRRFWTVEQKREIVAESLGSELTPTEVARKHGIGSGQLYTWRQQLLSRPGAMIERSVPRFAEVDLPLAAPDAATAAPISEHALPGRPATARTGGLIEIVLPDGVSLRVDAEVDGQALCRVLDALGRR